MNRFLALAVSILLLSGCATTRLEDTGSATGLGASPFSTGGTFTAAQANAINDAVNDNDSRLDLLEALSGLVFSDGDGTYTTITGVSAAEVGYLSGVTSDIQTQIDAKQASADMAVDVPANETDPSALKTAGTDNVKDTHIDWGSGAGQVNLADIPGGTAGANTFDFSGATFIRPKMTVELATGGAITETYMRYDTIFYEDAAGQIDIETQATDFECTFYIENRGAASLEIAWDEAGANPYLSDAQVGADTNICLPAGATVEINRQLRGGVGEWRCYIINGLVAAGSCP